MNKTVNLNSLLDHIAAPVNDTCEFCGRNSGEPQTEDRSFELQRHLVQWCADDWASFLAAYAALASERHSLRDVQAMLVVGGRPILSRGSLARALIRARDRWGVDALPRAAGARRVR